MLKIFNDLTQRKEEFIPLEENMVKMYVCGPTVYDDCHIGHARSFIVFDVIRRYLEFKGFKVIYITNFTDIDDKMIKRANEEKTTIFNLAEKYINSYFEDCDKLNIKRATEYPRATELIDEMIKINEILIKKKNAYISEGNVYFNISSFPNYAKLSNVNLEETRSSENDIKKKNPHDFALWKAKKNDEPSWSSPWGQGRPGWHIECSAMSQKYLGDTIDIHGGGRDLIFPHHENEIAQSEAYTGKQFVRYWIHNGFVTINKEKMSKSLGNFFTIKDVIKKYKPETIRYFLISSHYRNPIDYSEENLIQADRTYRRFNNTIILIKQLIDSKMKIQKDSDQFKHLLKITKDKFIEAMDDDFNTPKALSELSELIKYINKLESQEEVPSLLELKQAQSLLNEIGDVLGILPNDTISDELLNNLIELTVEIRNELREIKRFELSDKIRDKLKELGIQLTDSKTSTSWKFI
ncbi:MAG: cysteine--tRNA ligase [Candidatus Lokiarchaeota archaeon]|nr:cysteine--tRNA ligase [Candidatus Lokiarchaeota archaeon]